MTSIKYKPTAKTGARGGVLMNHLSVRLPQSLNLRLVKMAHKRRVTKAHLVRDALDVELTKREKHFDRLKKGNKK